jgi:uncharacterized protein DUF3658
MIYQRLAKVFLIRSNAGKWEWAMDEIQATELHGHLDDAIQALQRAGGLISSLEEGDQSALLISIDKITSAIEVELLQEAVYARFPDLRSEFDERSFLDTVRRWEDIVLHEDVSDADIDAVIFSALKTQWRKTARIIIDTLKECERLQLPVSAEMLGVRIQALDEANKLESQGDLRKWRFSEVRLKS